MRMVLIFVLAVILVACASPNKNQVSFNVPNDSWWQSASFNASADIGEKNLATVRKKMIQVVPFPFSVGFANTSEINAYAELQNNQRYVIFTSGFMKQFGDDPDVLASVMGHELAHHQLGHTQLGYAKNRNLAIDATSQALGMLASYFVPFSGLLVGNAVKGVGLSYSRDDERESDYQGMQWAFIAGYSPCGSYRFAAKMNSMSESVSLTFLSTHPGNTERMEASQQFAQKMKAITCDIGLDARN